MDNVVQLHYPQPEIAVISIQEREGRNTLTKRLCSGINQAFDDIEANPSVKVVVTQGYENYYLCGGTKEELIELTKGETSFAELDFFTRPLRCKLPTIAAVHGHAIGGGLAFACLHDFIFLASGVIYSANFMKYGFTPGMGSTYTIPKRFGIQCGQEMLFTAKHYCREELERMNCMLPFYPKNEVVELALELAKQISDKTMVSIKLLKEQLSSETRKELPGVIENEKRMHAKTITTEEAIRRIKSEYGI